MVFCFAVILQFYPNIRMGINTTCHMNFMWSEWIPIILINRYEKTTPLNMIPDLKVLTKKLSIPGGWNNWFSTFLNVENSQNCKIHSFILQKESVFLYNI